MEQVMDIAPIRAVQEFFYRLSPSAVFLFLAALPLIAASATANFMYGANLGSSAVESLVGGFASIGAELYTAIGLAAVGVLWRKNFQIQGLAAAFVWCLTLAYTLNAGLGFASVAKDTQVAKRSVQVNAASDRRFKLDTLQAQLKALPVPTSTPAAMQSKITGILKDSRSENCEVINGKYTRKWCPVVEDLKSQIVIANRRQQLEGALAKVVKSSKLQTLHTASVGSADPHSAALVYYLKRAGYQSSESDVRPWLYLLFVVMVVLGGPVLLWCAETSLRPKRERVAVPAKKAEDPKPPRKDDVGPPNLKVVKTSTPKPAVKRAQKNASTAARALAAIERAGGRVTYKSKVEATKALKMSRSSLYKALDVLKDAGEITVIDQRGQFTLAAA